LTNLGAAIAIIQKSINDNRDFKVYQEKHPEVSTNQTLRALDSYFSLPFQQDKSRQKRCQHEERQKKI
jgi:hypothetical protein